ncbi:hypothetical protein [Cupriavidus plantarum]
MSSGYFFIRGHWDLDAGMKAWSPGTVASTL